MLYHFVPPDSLIDALRERAAAIVDLREYLLERLKGAWTKRWIKAPAKKRHLKPVKHKKGTAGHFSIHRAIVETSTKDV